MKSLRVTAVVLAVLLTVPLTTTTAAGADGGFLVEPVDADGPIFNRALDENLGKYTESEYVVAGTASDYAFGADLETIEVIAEDQRYRTRIVVRRPTSNKASGTVMIEWLNPTATWDGTPMWDLTHQHLVREGITWVGDRSRSTSL